MKIPFQMRLDCPNSFGTDDSFHLRCEVGGGVCDGTLYECCMWDKSFAEQIEQIAFMQAQTPLIQRLMVQEGEQE